MWFNVSISSKVTIGDLRQTTKIWYITRVKNALLCSDDLPLFGSITPEDIEPAIDHLLQTNQTIISNLPESATEIGWETVQCVEAMHHRLQCIWSPVAHLHAVTDHQALREAYNVCVLKLSEYAAALGHNKKLYQVYRAVAESDEYVTLDDAQKKIISNALRDFKLAGFDLDQDAQQEFRDIKRQLSRLETRFEENLLDATQGWSRHITDEHTLAGLPESVRTLAQQTAEDRGCPGWILTLDTPCYVPIMRYADNAALREVMYTAYITRASDQGPHAGRWDNSEIMSEILSLRRRQSELLGYPSYAHYSLATKMAETPDDVLAFLNDLAACFKEKATQEFVELQSFVRTEFGVTQLYAWDIEYYSEKLRHKKHALSQEDLRPYFPVPQVMRGMFAIVNRLYGIDVRPRQHVKVWHNDVCFFDVFDGAGVCRGSFYLDLYARSGKRDGAWVDECQARIRSGTGVRRPVAYITCNFSPPVGDHPSQLTHDEVITLFHEFGHALHHILTLVDHPGVAGINGVPWDAVELPSQLMENWCWQRQALDLIARHYRAHDPIDDCLFDKMVAAKNFQIGMRTLRQLEFALFDFHLHLATTDQSSDQIQALLDELRRRIAVVSPPDYSRFQHSFSHIFAGGYAAGYYSYQWAEVLSADAFSKFEENSVLDPKVGKQFLHTFLEQGGVKDPLELFIHFRGRKPSIHALLAQSGVTARIGGGRI